MISTQESLLSDWGGKTECVWPSFFLCESCCLQRAHVLSCPPCHTFHKANAGAVGSSAGPGGLGFESLYLIIGFSMEVHLPYRCHTIRSILWIIEVKLWFPVSKLFCFIFQLAGNRGVIYWASSNTPIFYI